MLGILGGMSWTSTAAYYRGLNQGVQARLGGGIGVRAVQGRLQSIRPPAHAEHRAGPLLGIARAVFERPLDESTGLADLRGRVGDRVGGNGAHRRERRIDGALK